MKRVILAGVLAGITLFAWTSISHVVLQLGDQGMQTMPQAQEQAFLAALKQNVSTPGLYFFPGMNMELTGDAAKAEQERWTELYRTQPSGLLVFRATGGEPMPPSMLVGELLSNIVTMLLAAWVVWRMRLASYVSRVMVMFVIGLIAATETNFSYWNWYGFPGNYTAAQMADIAVGYLLAGLVVAAIARPERGSEFAR